MSKKLLNQLRTRLKDRRHHLLREVELRLRELRDSAGNRMTDTVDIASNLIEDEIVMSIAQCEAREIEQIDNALSKIGDGNYGICESCGKKINKQRLMAIPFVNLCVKCKEAEERDEESSAYRGGYYRLDSNKYAEFDADYGKGSSLINSEDNNINPYDN